MAITFRNTDPNHGADRLGFALFLALAVHAIVILGVGFKFTERSPVPPSLEVTLAVRPSVAPVEEARHLAAADQQGSGEADALDKLSSIERSAFDNPQQRQVRRAAAASRSSDPAPELINATESARQAVFEFQPDSEGPVQEPLAESQVMPAAEALSSLQARLDRQQRAYSSLPKTLRLTAASAKAADHAAYLSYWIEAVENTGNIHYPQAARARNLYGDVLMVVSILPDGSVDGIEVVTSSGQPLLDEAARQTVLRAAPFAHFPPGMSQWDRIEITRTWRYIPGNRVTTVAQ